ncbi:molecular chaperone DnaK [Candidatus Micrarchaeota archaeon]|nr:molecular chaperone DnaK [Candidatus Micrarchaeota archaeon]
MGKTIGIDLGTSNSAAAVMEGGIPTIIPSAEGASQYGKSFPSVIAFAKEGRLVGEPARRQAVTNPEKTIIGAKRKIGTDFKYKIGEKEFSPQEISAFVLQKIKKDSEAFLGETVDKAVITVPAYFNDNQRQATKDAGKIAGLEVLRLVNEPTAACLAYGLNKSNEEHKILVFDFGGGTLDVTIMEFGEGVFEVKSTSGDTQLGGHDMDDKIMGFLFEEIKKVHGIDVNNDATATQRIREAAEKAKIELSSVLTSEINLPFIAMKENQPVNFSYQLTRAKLEELVRPIIEKCRKPVEQAIKDAGVTKDSITKIMLIGGPTRMPIVQKFVEDFAGKKVERGVDPMEAVAKGAAIQAAIISGDVKDILLLDVTPLSLGIETLGGVFTKLIERNTTIPTEKSQVFSTAADFQTSVDIKVYQGERPIAGDNVLLGQFTLEGMPPAKRGIPQIEVRFDIDANGILNTSATDKATGKKQSIRITAPLKMDEEKIKQRMEEAKKFEEEDKKKKEIAEAKNEAETIIYASTNLVSGEMKDKINEDEKKEIDEKSSKLRELMNGEDNEAIKQGSEELKKSLEKIGARMYQQAGAQEPQGEQKETGEEKTYEAETEKKDDEEKKQ